MIEILFIGGPLDGTARRVANFVDRIDAVAPESLDVSFAALPNALDLEPRPVLHYFRRELTDGRELFVLEGMTDAEVLSRL